MRPVPPPEVEQPRAFGDGELYTAYTTPQYYDRYIPTKKQADTYDDIIGNRGVPIRGYGEDSKGNKYQRYFDYGPGGQELMYLAAGLRKDLRRIPGTQTKAGAQAWIAKNKKKNWSALEEDFTGPENKPDGIKEVVITDAKGRVKVVNGYALKNSDYPWRKAYYTKYPERQAQRENPFAEFKYQGMMPGFDPNENGTYGYMMNLPKGMRPNITPRTMYRKRIFTPSYKLFQDILDEIKWSAMDKARLSGDIFKACYESIIVKPAVGDRLGYSAAQMQVLEEKQYKKLLHKDEFKDVVRAELNKYLVSADGYSELLLKTVWLIVHSLEELLNIEIPKNREVYGVSLATLMRFRDVQAIDAGLTEELRRPVIDKWKEQNAAMDTALHTAWTKNLEKGNERRAATKAAHDLYVASDYAKGNSLGRRDAMFGDFHGLERNDRYGGYYRHQGYAPLDIPAPEHEEEQEPEPSPEEILAAKIDKFYEISELERNDDLTKQLEQFIKEEIPNREINYYGSPGFLNEFIKWRKTTLRAIYDDVINDEDVKIKKKQIETYFTKVATYYDVNMDSTLDRDDVKALVKYLLQERPTLRDIRTSSFRVKFLTDQAEKLLSNGE